MCPAAISLEKIGAENFTNRAALQRGSNDLLGGIGQIRGQNPLSFDANSAPEDMEVDTTSAGRKDPEHQPVTKRSALRLVSQCLQSTLSDSAAPIKRIARIAEVDRKTAAAWYNGHSAPGIHHLLNLMVEIPELAGEIRRITRMERELHEDLQRDIAALIQKAIRR